MRQRFAVMAGGGKSGACRHCRDLAAQQRYLARIKAIGARSEQADKAVLAGKGAVGVEGFDADIIHMHPAMHQAHAAGFGDDQRFGFAEESLHIRRQGAWLGRAAQHPLLRIGQSAKAGFIARVQPGCAAFHRQPVIARAQEREMIVAQPIEKGDVLADINAFGRRCGQFVARLLQPQQHGAPVAHRQKSLRKGFGHAVFQRPFVGDHIQHQHNDADGNAVLLDDGMEGGPDAAAAGGSGAQRGIKQEWPVVIDRHQHVAFARRRQQLHINLPLRVVLQHAR